MCVRVVMHERYCIHKNMQIFSIHHHDGAFPSNRVTSHTHHLPSCIAKASERWCDGKPMLSLCLAPFKGRSSCTVPSGAKWRHCSHDTLLSLNRHCCVSQAVCSDDQTQHMHVTRWVMLLLHSGRMMMQLIWWCTKYTDRGIATSWRGVIAFERSSQRMIYVVILCNICFSL